MVADFLGTDHHEILVDDRKVIHAMDQMAYHHDEPVGDAAILNNYLLSQEARKYVKVGLAGDGGDELFAGYDNYARCKYVHRVRSKALLGKLLPWLAHHCPGRGDLRRGWGEKELSMLEEGDINHRLSLSTREMSPRELSWITGLKNLNLESLGWRHPGFQSDLNVMLYNDCRNRMGENYLMKTDKANMANSIEVRLPLLDRQLAEYAFTLPSSMKLRGGTEKYILRRALRDRLPQEILDRKKMGFSTPVSEWMRGEIGEAAVEKVSGSELIRSCTDPTNLRKWVIQAEARKLRRPRAFWNLYALARWHEAYFL
jgi:asparagine synthase (glutamine-hydrolysing)